MDTPPALIQLQFGVTLTPSGARALLDEFCPKVVHMSSDVFCQVLRSGGDLPVCGVADLYTLMRFAAVAGMAETEFSE